MMPPKLSMVVIFCLLPLKALAFECADKPSEYQECLQYQKDDKLTKSCIDHLSAHYLGHGSVSLSETIVDACFSEDLRRFHREISFEDVKKAANSGGVLDFAIPEQSKALDYMMFKIYAQKEFDCHSTHPGSLEMTCNTPIDMRWEEENWPYMRDNLGQTRERFLENAIKEADESEKRRNYLRELQKEEQQQH